MLQLITNIHCSQQTGTPPLWVGGDGGREEGGGSEKEGGREGGKGVREGKSGEGRENGDVREKESQCQ